MLIGFLAGAVVGNLIAMLSAGNGAFYSPMLLERFDSPVAAILVQSLLSALIGVAGMGGMSLYDETDLPLASATAIHFALVEAVFVSVALFLRWMRSAVEIGVMTGIMFAAFTMIWVIMFIIHKREVRQLNEIAREKENADKKEEK